MQGLLPGLVTPVKQVLSPTHVLSPGYLRRIINKAYGKPDFRSIANHTLYSEIMQAFTKHDIQFQMRTQSAVLVINETPDFKPEPGVRFIKHAVYRGWYIKLIMLEEEDAD